MKTKDRKFWTSLKDSAPTFSLTKADKLHVIGALESALADLEALEQEASDSPYYAFIDGGTIDRLVSALEIFGVSPPVDDGEDDYDDDDDDLPF